MNIKITSDSTCDLSQELIQQHNITILPLTVIKDDVNYADGVTITPAEIFEHVAAGGGLCSTAAANVSDYIDLFGSLSEKYDAVVHINIGAGFSCSHQNACLAAAEFENVRAIDSMNLSTGQGLVVLKACELAKTCDSLDELCEKLNAFTPRVEASFLLDQLAYMVKGGRCSSVAALGANLLNLKPCIEVKGGKMSAVKKYRGNFTKSLTQYIKERLTNRTDIDNQTLFVTYTTVTDECLAAVEKAVSEYADFENIYYTQAGCTVSCHCGPDTLGVIFVRTQN